MPATISTYPDYEQQVRKLVQQHRSLHDEHLHLAVYFAPPNRPKRDVYLFEVIERFGDDSIDPDQELFTFAYGSTPGFPLPAGTSLRMVLTNPVELNEAVRQDWKRVKELRASRKNGKATVIYADAKGKKFWNELK